jgi:hypothetical protein
MARIHIRLCVLAQALAADFFPFVVGPSKESDFRVSQIGASAIEDLLELL